MLQRILIQYASVYMYGIRPGCSAHAVDHSSANTGRRVLFTVLSMVRTLPMQGELEQS